MNRNFKIIQKDLSASQISLYFFENKELFPRILSGEIDREVFSEKINKNAIQFCAFDAEEMAGFLAIYFNNHEKKIGYLTTISVRKKFQNNGIAKRLMINSINYGKKNGFKKIELEVNENNLVAINLYISLGFEIVNRTDANLFKKLSLYI